LETLDSKEREYFLDLLERLKKENYISNKFLMESKIITENYNKKELKKIFLGQKRNAYYEVTHRCNLKCKFCYASPGLVTDRFLGDLELSKKILERAKLINIKTIVITGGEPLLREDIFDLISFAKNHIDKVLITTNGILIDKKIGKKLKECGPDIVSISLDSSIKEQHDYLRGEGTFDKVIKAINYLKEVGFEKDSINITATITKHNIEDLPGLSDFAEELGVSMNYSFFQPIGRGKKAIEMQFSKKQYLEFILSFMKAQKDIIPFEVEDYSRLTNNTEKLSGDLIPSPRNQCGMVNGMIGIKPNGDLVPCHLFFFANDKKMLIGNILDEDIIVKMWNFAKKIPTVDEKEECKDCNVRYFCGGSCYAPGYFQDGTLMTRCPTCDPVRDYYSELVKCLGEKNEPECLYNKMVNICNNH
jgi:radical SAM protein with 4Fe4S-binding SPASM domain